MTTRSPRRGFTLIEVIVVMAILILLAAAVLPSIGAIRGDTRPQAAADAIRSELAAARGRAMTEGRPYRVALGQNGTHLRRGPDGSDFATAAAFGHPDGSAVVVDYELEHVTATILSEPSISTASDDWSTVAIVLPTGACLDDNVYVGVRERENTAGASLRVHIRGLTGSARVVPNSTNINTNTTGGER